MLGRQGTFTFMHVHHDDPFSISSTKTVEFRILVPLTFSAYFGVINHSTNFRPIVFEYPVYPKTTILND